MEKLPPHDYAAENAVIACLIIGTEAPATIHAIIQLEDFLQEKARWTYEAILSLEKRGWGIDQITVHYELEKLGYLDKVGRDYLSNIIATMPGVFGVHYAMIVKDMSDRRKKILEAGRMAKAAYEGKNLKSIYKGVKIG